MQNKPAHSSTSLKWFGGSQSLLIAYRWKTKETNWYCWYCNDSKFTMSSMVGLRIYILHNLFIKGDGQKKVWLYHWQRRFAMRTCNQPVKVASWCSWSDYSKIKANEKLFNFEHKTCHFSRNSKINVKTIEQHMSVWGKYSIYYLFFHEYFISYIKGLSYLIFIFRLGLLIRLQCNKGQVCFENVLFCNIKVKKPRDCFFSPRTLIQAPFNFPCQFSC